MSYRIGNKYLEIPDINSNDPADNTFWNKLRQMGLAYETVFSAIIIDAEAVKNNPHMWNNRYQAFRWFDSNVANRDHYNNNADHDNVRLLDDNKSAQMNGFKAESFKKIITDDISHDWNYPGSYDAVNYSDTLKVDWIKAYKKNLITLINYFNNTFWGWFDGNGWCIRSCQVSCQQSCQLACQSCQHNTCHNQHCSI